MGPGNIPLCRIQRPLCTRLHAAFWSFVLNRWKCPLWTEASFGNNSPNKKPHAAGSPHKSAVGCSRQEFCKYLTFPKMSVSLMSQKWPTIPTPHSIKQLEKRKNTHKTDVTKRWFIPQIPSCYMPSRQQSFQEQVDSWFLNEITQTTCVSHKQKKHKWEVPLGHTDEGGMPTRRMLSVTCLHNSDQIELAWIWGSVWNIREW